jgi:hypothetical protein
VIGFTASLQAQGFVVEALRLPLFLLLHCGGFAGLVFQENLMGYASELCKLGGPGLMPGWS